MEQSVRIALSEDEKLLTGVRLENSEDRQSDFDKTSHDFQSKLQVFPSFD